MFAALELRKTLPHVRFTPAQWRAAFELVGLDGLRPLPPPPEEAHLRGRRHSPRARRRGDRAPLRRLERVLPDRARPVDDLLVRGVGLARRRRSKTRRRRSTSSICRKLELEPGMRLLDIGCGWGGMVMHAAQHHGVRAVGVTVSRRQAELAAKRVAEAGLTDRVEIRLQDYRDVRDGPYDAISSIGMFEHVGLAQLGEYFDRVHAAPRARWPAAQPRDRPPARSPTTRLRPGGHPVPARRLHRPVRVPRRRAPRARRGGLGAAAHRLRGPAHGEPARALRADPAGVGAQPRGRTGTTRSPRPARPGRASGGSTWPAPR